MAVSKRFHLQTPQQTTIVCAASILFHLLCNHVSVWIRPVNNFGWPIGVHVRRRDRNGHFFLLRMLQSVLSGGFSEGYCRFEQLNNCNQSLKEPIHYSSNRSPVTCYTWVPDCRTQRTTTESTGRCEPPCRSSRSAPETPYRLDAPECPKYRLLFSPKCSTPATRCWRFCGR